MTATQKSKANRLSSTERAEAPDLSQLRVPYEVRELVVGHIAAQIVEPSCGRRRNHG
jgi:hypothetical protein